MMREATALMIWVGTTLSLKRCMRTVMKSSGCWTKGRLGPIVKSLLGPDKLPVLTPRSILMISALWKALGQQVHEGPQVLYHAQQEDLGGADV